MSNTAVFWDSTIMFHKLVEETTGPVDSVTPLILAAPFFRGKFSGIIIPTGFGNTHYSRMLPALRACASRIEDYLEDGGKLLVYGAADASPARYDWLPVSVDYHFEFLEHDVEADASSKWKGIIDGYDCSKFACDGWFENVENGRAVVTSKTVGKPGFVEVPVGKGTLLLASTHEYPTVSFLQEFKEGEPVSF